MKSLRSTWTLAAALGCMAMFTLGCPTAGTPDNQGDMGDSGNQGDMGDSGNQGDMNNGNGQPTNAAPTANAGTDRTVLKGGAVSLTGTASDPDGDSLTVSWKQTSGTAVTLAGASTLTASFTAPSAAAVLVFELTVDDGKGQTASDSVTVTVNIPPAFLFVANNDTGRITSYSTDNINGEIEPSGRIDAGATTSLFQVRSILVTPDGQLFATRQNGGIAIYDDALSILSDTPADRVVDGAKSLLDSPISLAYDAGSDTMYVGNINAEEGILAFADVSKTGFDGDIAPTRMFSTDDRAPDTAGVSVLMTIDALWLDADGSLYASDTSGNNVNSSRILVFDDAASADGETAASREITSSSFGNIEDLTIDKDGRLYVVDQSNNVYVFDNASSLDGQVAPDATITITGSPTPNFHGIAVDSNGVGYIADREYDAIYSLAEIAKLDGTVTDFTILEGFDSRVAGPRQIWVFEP
jgi:hypothetical protein